jgi:hypothetical protein
VLFFPFLAVIIWYFAGKYRRTWRGVLTVFIGMATFALLEIALIRAGALGIGGIQPWLVIWLLIISMGLVGVVSVFIFLMPYPPPAYVHCRKCRYNLSGLDAADLRCPECGTVWARPTRCPHCRHELRGLGPDAIWCPECRALLVPQALAARLAAHQPPPGADQEHDHGQPRDEHPTEGDHLPLAEHGNERH